MRCGKESMNMLWQHIEWHTDHEQRYLRIWVSGKTGGRWLIAKHKAATALERLAQRQRSVSMSPPDAIAAQLPQRVFTLDDGSQPYGLAGTFQRLLACMKAREGHPYADAADGRCCLLAMAVPLETVWATAAERLA
jgi:hypothetical protein